MGLLRVARARFTFDNRVRSYPSGVESVTALSGGAIELRDGDVVVLRGSIPAFATVRGANAANATVAFRASVDLVAAPHQEPKRGALDVRVTNVAGGTRQELSVSLTTYDRLAHPATVVVIDAGGDETILGTITPSGRDGSGALRFDSRRGGVLPGGGLFALSGGHVEVRDAIGTVLVAGEFPIVE